MSFAIFTAGLWCGSSLGVFSLSMLEISVAAFGLVGERDASLFEIGANLFERGAVLMAGFVVALVLSCLFAAAGIGDRSTGHPDPFRQ